MQPEHWLYTIPLRLRSLFRWAQADQELDDELRDHLERKTEEYVAQGMAPEEARRRARLDLGGIEQTKEKCRDARRVNWIQDFVQDLRFGLRVLRKAPGFTAAAILSARHRRQHGYFQHRQRCSASAFALQGFTAPRSSARRTSQDRFSEDVVFPSGLRRACARTETF